MESLETMLVKIGQERFGESLESSAQLLEDASSNSLLNDLTHFPHAFVLACGMDRQIKTERAWMIPIKIRELLGTFELSSLAQVSLEEYVDIFNHNSLHRFNSVMAKTFYSAVQKIAKDYNGDASRIWNDRPSSAAVVYRFLQFDGYGIKIATMATNILARQFKVSLLDYYSIDISPDVHVFRVLTRCGIIAAGAGSDSVIYKARELNPEFPGIIDFSCWEIGRTWCKPESPDCVNCILSEKCRKLI